MVTGPFFVWPWGPPLEASGFPPLSALALVPPPPHLLFLLLLLFVFFLQRKRLQRRVDEVQ